MRQLISGGSERRTSALRTAAGEALDDADGPEDDQILAWALEDDIDVPDGY